MNIANIIIKNEINGFHDNYGNLLDGGTDKNTDHSYCDYYDSIFSQYIDKEISILEIGTYQGGWAYSVLECLPKSKITCIDIKNQFSNKLLTKIQNNRLNFIEKNAYDKSVVDFLKTNNLSFDIIMEDGPHTLSSQVFAIKEYSSLLKEDGVMILEDIQSENDLNVLVQIIDETKFSYKIIDLRKNKNRYDDLIIELRKI